MATYAPNAKWHEKASAVVLRVAVWLVRLCDQDFILEIDLPSFAIVRNVCIELSLP